MTIWEQKKADYIGTTIIKCKKNLVEHITYIKHNQCENSISNVYEKQEVMIDF